jgi:hypothetical protein
LNLISQRKSISTPDISNGQSTFSVSSTEQASSAENLVPSSRTSDQVVHVNRLISFFHFISVCLAYARIL